MNTQIKSPKQVKRTVSYGSNEAIKLKKMETVLMEYYGYDYSQLHKVLIRDRYNQVSL
jgi:hypothetical protein